VEPAPERTFIPIIGDRSVVRFSAISSSLTHPSRKRGRVSSKP
jgi:hypothetical protein